ncbi:unnamed protein product [Spirodela intermedia]|uniref:Uncharacterized protein n=1 Tax=Spirodela intermedia TaxID=51605 RepID=A0ABN7EBE2_SPIIN|nr:unnamed protein product [Spirodela intermedia]
MSSTHWDVSTGRLMLTRTPI